MEAEIYQEIADAIQSRKNHILIPVENSSPILKIVWASFDYMAGPELQFTWEANLKQTSSNTNHSNTSDGINKINTGIQSDVDNDIETVDGCISSSDSSFSKNTGGSSTTHDRFEDIDEYKELLQLSSEKYDNFEINYNCKIGNFSQPLHSAASTSQTQCTDETLTNLTNDQQSTPSTIKDEEMANKLLMDETGIKDEVPTEKTMVTSCVDSGIAGTISMDSNLSSFATQEPKDEVFYQTNNEFCNIHFEKNRKFTCGNIHEAQEVIEFDHDAYSDVVGAEEKANRHPSKGGHQMQCSFMSNQIGSSFYSTCSNPHSQPTNQASIEKSTFYKEAELLATELSSSESMGSGLSDEAFVAKQVLAEQIGSIQLTTNPILHKFCIVPARHIAFGSYIFSTRVGEQPISGAPNLSAFSVIMPVERAEWFLERQQIFQEIFSDIIARFKAAHVVEGLEDLVCRSTREFATLFSLFGALERWPLAGKEIQRIRIQSSHLWELRKDKEHEGREFIVRCITACLICRGRCTLVGSNSDELSRLMMTLCAFLEPKDRIVSLKPHKIQFSPYLRLQAIKRSELHQFFEHAANAHWPCSLVDIDRKSVVYTGLYHKHRAQKKTAQLFQVSQIFREAQDSGLDVPMPILEALDQQLSNGPRTNVLETQVVRVDPAVYTFMDQIGLLPLNRAARISFVDHFHLRVQNQAKALISFVRDTSVPSPSDKRSALSSKWHLATVRRNLNLQQDSAYGIVFARADSLQPEFAEFVIQQTTAAGRHLNH